MVPETSHLTLQKTEHEVVSFFFSVSKQQ